MHFIPTLELFLGLFSKKETFKNEISLTKRKRREREKDRKRKMKALTYA